MVYPHVAGIPRLGRGRTATLLTLALTICNAAVAQSQLKHGVMWYSSTNDNQILTQTAARYSIGVTGKELPANKVEMKTLNPDFLWFVYNSGSDNYVPPQATTPEHDLLVSKAEARGWDEEGCYMHYWDDTQVVLEGETVLIPGWGGGSATDPAQARIPVYNKNLTRRLICTSTPYARQLHKEVFLELAFGTPFSGTSLYADGMFLDNNASSLYNYGQISSGGHVREAPGHPLLGSSAFQTWYWNQNYAPYLTALKDTLQTSASWSPDGKRKYLMINVANIWSDSYVTLDVADYIFQEFQYNAVRDSGVNMPAEAYRRDRLAADAGITCFYPATMTRTVSGKPGAFSYGQTMLGNLAWYLVTRSERTHFFEMGTSTPSTAGWDTLTWRGCLDVANTYFGDPVGDPYVITQGTDPLGNTYQIHARQYTGGLALVRPRGDWNQGIEPETAVSVSLPAAMIPINYSGTLGAEATSVSLRNGQGALFLSGSVDVRLLAFSVTRSEEGAVLTWEVAADPTDAPAFHVHREREDGSREQLTPLPLTGTGRFSFVDPGVRAGETRYWLAELERNGDVRWHGPMVLSAGSARQTIPTLAQNLPNPFRAATEIRFEIAQEGGTASLRVFDLSGRQVARLAQGPWPVGSHQIRWEGTDDQGRRLPAGLYVYRLDTPQGSLSRKLVLTP